MIELKNIFEEIDKDRELMVSIRQEFKSQRLQEDEIFYNYYFYQSLVSYKMSSIKEIDYLSCMFYFILKEDNITNSIAALNNTYQICNMMSEKEIFKLLIGKKSSIISLNSDAAKMGALLSLIYKSQELSKTEVLEKTLLFYKNVL